MRKVNDARPLRVVLKFNISHKNGIKIFLKWLISKFLRTLIGRFINNEMIIWSRMKHVWYLGFVS